MNRFLQPTFWTLLRPRNNVIKRGIKRRVAIAMSGGIDSSVAAMLMQEKGFDCIGVFMKNWEGSDEEGETACPIDRDRMHMRQVCERLRIPAYDVEFVKEYWNEVFVPFVSMYQAGIDTPNPDVYCNRHVKFDCFMQHVKNKFGIDEIATGHYARLGKNSESGHVQLMRAVDPIKDQTYFLSLTRGEQFRNVHFPVGEFTKQQVKLMAEEKLRGLDVLNKKESMGICFIGKRDFSSFMSNYLTTTAGRCINVDTGLSVGTHKGKELITIGQRIGISGYPHKLFVVSKNPSYSGIVNRRHTGYKYSVGDIFVANGSGHPALYSRTFEVDHETFNWLPIRPHSPPSGNDADPYCADNIDTFLASQPKNKKYFAKIRHKESSEECAVEIIDGAEDGRRRRLRITFDSPVRAISTGQICALYDGSVCLGGGVINRIGESEWEKTAI